MELSIDPTCKGSIYTDGYNYTPNTQNEMLCRASQIEDMLNEDSL